MSAISSQLVLTALDRGKQSSFLEALHRKLHLCIINLQRDLDETGIIIGVNHRPETARLSTALTTTQDRACTQQTPCLLKHVACSTTPAP